MWRERTASDEYINAKLPTLWSWKKESVIWTLGLLMTFFLALSTGMVVNIAYNNMKNNSAKQPQAALIISEVKYIFPEKMLAPVHASDLRLPAFEPQLQNTNNTFENTNIDIDTKDLKERLHQAIKEHDEELGTK